MKKKLIHFFMFVFLFVLYKDLAAADSLTFPKPLLDHDHTIIKFFPFSMAAGQLGQYCSELRFAIEQKIAKHQSLQIGFAFDYPSVFSLMSQSFQNLGDDGEGTKSFIGGRILLAYRYYFNKKAPPMTGFYGAIEGSFNYLVSKPTFDVYIDKAAYVNGGLWETSFYKAHCIMSNYGITLGYQFEKITKRKGRHVVIDAGVNGNCRYYYFWRHYSYGNLEFARENVYAFYKQFPLGGAINFSIGGFLGRKVPGAVHLF
jgi:hypothetical protein